jgi:superfamily II DNA or RNA helicase
VTHLKYCLIEAGKDVKSFHIQIQEQNRRRIDPERLRTLALPLEKPLVEWLIKEQLRKRMISPLDSRAETVEMNEISIEKERLKEALSLFALSSRVFWKGKPLHFCLLKPLSFFWRVTSSEDRLEIEGRFHLNNEEIALSTCDRVFYSQPANILYNQALYFLPDKIDPKWIEWVYPSSRCFTGRQAKEWQEDLKERAFPGLPSIHWIEIAPKATTPLPLLRLRDSLGTFADLFIDYGEGKTISFSDPKTYPWRNLKEERLWEKDLLEVGFIKKMGEYGAYFCPSGQVISTLHFLLGVGWTIFHSSGKQLLLLQEIQTDIRSQKDTWVLEGEVSFGQERTSFPHILENLALGNPFISLSDTKMGLVDRDTLFKELKLTEAGQEIIRQKGHLPKSHIATLQPLFQTKGIAPLVERSADPNPSFTGTLYPYQKQGIDWMQKLYLNGFSGLLADEMGLGKTVQVLAFLSQIEEKDPILIIMPTTLLFQWHAQGKKFLPDWSFYIHSGDKREKSLDLLGQKKIIFTSYALLRQDASLFQSLTYSCIILDEAQAIKNSRSQLAQVCFSLRSKWKLALSGTPIENSLSDLQSIFHFLIPDLLKNVQSFPHMMRMIQPFFLRRKKELVAQDIPEKEEQLIWIEMTAEQREIYETFKKQVANGLIKKIRESGTFQPLEVLETILRLRQIACHPGLVNPLYLDVPSGKMEILLEDLQIAFEQKRKVLVYSQFTQMLQIIHHRLRENGQKALYLDGQTKDRETPIRQFQEDPDSTMLLLSLKVGSVGLNLTAADYIFLFDPWWNEAVEDQAISRSHRLGRQKGLIARRYLCAQTIEEKVHELKRKKKELADAVLESEGGAAKLSMENVLFLLEDDFL